MRRENRPQFPPGSIPGPNTSRPRPPPGLPNPNLPVTAQQQQAALVAHRKRSNSIAYDALIAGNSDPVAAIIPRPTPPPEGPFPAAAAPFASGGLLHPPAHTNGVASGVNSPRSPAPYAGPLHPLRSHKSQELPSGSSTATGSPAFQPTSASFGTSSTIPQASTAPPAIPQADGADSESPLQIAVNPRTAVQDDNTSNQATAPASVQASDPLAQAVPAPDPTGIANLTISDTASADPSPGSNNTSQ